MTATAKGNGHGNGFELRATGSTASSQRRQKVIEGLVPVRWAKCIAAVGSHRRSLRQFGRHPDAAKGLQGRITIYISLGSRWASTNQSRVFVQKQVNSVQCF